MKSLIRVANVINYLLLGFSLITTGKGPAIFVLIRTRGKYVIILSFPLDAEASMEKRQSHYPYIL